MAKKQPMSSSTKGIIIVISVVGGIALLVIIAAIIIMFFVGGTLVNFAGSDAINMNTTEQNNAIQDQAIQQKDPSLCDTIKGNTTVSIPLPDGNQERTFDETASKQRCKTQAATGQHYDY